MIFIIISNLENRLKCVKWRLIHTWLWVSSLRGDCPHVSSAGDMIIFTNTLCPSLCSTHGQGTCACPRSYRIPALRAITRKCSLEHLAVQSCGKTDFWEIIFVGIPWSVCKWSAVCLKIYPWSNLIIKALCV